MTKFNLDNLLVFLPTLLPENTKPKVYDQIRDKYIKENVWELQHKLYSKIKDIKVSGAIGCNEIVLQPLQRELQDGLALAGKLESTWKRWKSIIPDTPEYNFTLIIHNYHKEAIESIMINYLPDNSISSKVKWAEQVYF